MISSLSALPPDRPNPVSPPQNDTAMRESARKLEAAFLSSMLQAAGVGAARENLGGGVGEEQFTSFLVQATAEQMVARGGIGLAESLFHAMKTRADGQG